MQNHSERGKEGVFLNQKIKGDPFLLFTFLIGILSLVISCLFPDPTFLISYMLIFYRSTSQLSFVIWLLFNLIFLGEEHSSAHLVSDTSLS